MLVIVDYNLVLFVSVKYTLNLFNMTTKILLNYAKFYFIYPFYTKILFI